jgi:hypothetical protein
VLGAGLLTVLMVAGLAPAAAAAAPGAGSGPPGPTARYIIQLDAPPLAGYSGGIQGYSATSPPATGGRLDLDSPASRRYQSFLDAREEQALATSGAPRESVIQRYRVAFPGFSARLTTGGQQSKSTPIGAVARFAEGGKQVPKKDLALHAMSYGHVYVARIAMGAKMQQTVQALQEAESWPGPSLVIAYSPCIAHGYDMAKGPEQQKLMVDSGAWPLVRFDPRRAAAGENALRLDSGPPKAKVADYMKNEARFRRPDTLDEETYARLGALAQRGAEERYALYQQLAAMRGAARPGKEA